MKKQIHILEGLFILTIILVCSLLAIKFLYNRNNEKVDTKYLWDVKFTNLKTTEGSKEGTIKLENNQIILEVELEKENEFYEFSIDAENNGNLDAILDKINLNIENEKNILKYYLYYKDKIEIKKGDILKSKTKNTIVLRIEYPKQESKVYDALKISVSLNLKYIATE